MTLADRAGKTLLVNLWATWRAPCRAEMPALDSPAVGPRAEPGFEVVAINVDTGDDTKRKKFLTETGVKDARLLSRQRRWYSSTGSRKAPMALGLPVTLLVDPEGCLIAGMNGPADWAGIGRGEARRLRQSAPSQSREALCNIFMRLEARHTCCRLCLHMSNPADRTGFLKGIVQIGLPFDLILFGGGNVVDQGHLKRSHWSGAPFWGC